MIRFVVFINGALIMIFELVASRVLAPYLGSSIYVWTSIIGVILASLSLGYYQGGFLADKILLKRNISDTNLDKNLLANLTLFSGFAIAITSLFEKSFLDFIVSLVTDQRLASLLACILLFAPASFLMGAVTSYSTRLEIVSLKTSGKALGTLYAISTLGSIVGTFLGGFFLIGYFGTKMILVLLAFTMLALSLLIFGISFFKNRKRMSILISTIVFSLNFLFDKDPQVILDTDSNYSRILVYDTIYPYDKRPIRVLSTFRLSQTAMYLEGDDLVFDYLKTFTLFDFFKKDTKKILMIGGGGYSIPKFILQNFKDKRIDVVEIDPKMTDIARKYFGLRDDQRVNIYHADGRSFINKINLRYDLIFLDAYKSDFSMPFELITLEALSEYKERLSDNGLLAINVISALEGEKSHFLKILVKTIKRVFPQVYIFKSNQDREVIEDQNVVIFALKSNLKADFGNSGKYKDEIKKLWIGNLDTDFEILTDDFAPIERYTLSLYK